MRRTLIVAFSVVLVVVALATAQVEPIRIGVVRDFSGPAAAFGKQLDAGLKLYLAQTAAVIGRPIQLMVEDYSSSVPNAVQKTAKLVERDRVVAIIGAMHSAAALAVSSRAKNTKTVYLETLAATDELTGAQRHDYVFRINTSASREGRLAARFLAERSITRVATVVGENPLSRATAAALAQELKVRKGVTVGVERWIKLGATDVAPDVAAVRAARPDVLVMVLPQQSLRLFVSAASQAGLLGEGRLILALGGVTASTPLEIMATDGDDPGWDDG